MCLLLVIGRLVIQKRQLKRADKKEQQSLNTTGEMTIPNGFSDDISEIDGDIDMTTSLSVPSVSRNEVNIIYAIIMIISAIKSNHCSRDGRTGFMMPLSAAPWGYLCGSLNDYQEQEKKKRFPKKMKRI